MAEFKGNIVPVEVKASKNYGDVSLGPCWVERDVKKTLNGKTMKHRSGNREFIVPANDGDLTGRLEMMIKLAIDEVYISSFLVESSEVTDALIEASKRGVMTVLLTARESELSLSEDELDGLSKSRKEAIEGHKKLLDALAGKVLVRTSPDFHAKYIIIDPFRAPTGILMTCNATKDAMNGGNVELAVTLLPGEVLSLFHHFIYGFWETAGYELLDSEKGSLEPVRRNDVNITHGAINLPATYGSNTTLKDAVLSTINSANKSLVISAWSFDKDGAIIEAISNAIDRGVSVEVLSRFAPQRAKNTEPLLPLAIKGATIRGHPRFHAKVVLADGKTGLIMTANFTSLGLDQGFEVGVALSGKEVETVSEIIRTLDDSCNYTLNVDMHVGDAPEKVQRFNNATKSCDEVVIKKSDSRQLPEKLFASCTDMPSYQIPDREFPKYGDKNVYVKTIEVRQFLKPPVLPKEAKLKEVKDVPFQVYGTGKEGKNNYLVVKQWEDIEKAKPYADNLKAKIVITQ